MSVTMMLTFIESESATDCALTLLLPPLQYHRENLFLENAA
jgi:hypothetical protein